MKILFILILSLFCFRGYSKDSLPKPKEINYSSNYNDLCLKTEDQKWTRFPNKDVCLKNLSQFETKLKNAGESSEAFVLELCKHFSQKGEKANYNCFRWQFEKLDRTPPFIKEQSFWKKCEEHKIAEKKGSCIKQELVSLSEKKSSAPPPDIEQLLKKEAAKQK